MVAQEFAVAYPQRVERLALACTSAGGEGESSYPLQKLLELPPGQRVAAELKVVDSRWDQRWLEAHPGDRAIAGRMTAAGQDQQDPAAVATYQAQLQAREGHDVWDRLGAITCPVLVGYGNYDGIAPALNSTNIASRIRGAELHGYEGGHGFLFQDPAAFPAYIAFLSTIEMTGGRKPRELPEAYKSVPRPLRDAEYGALAPPYVRLHGSGRRYRRAWPGVAGSRGVPVSADV